MAPRGDPIQLSALTADSRGLVNPPETTTSGPGPPIRFSVEDVVPGGTSKSGRGASSRWDDCDSILGFFQPIHSLRRLLKTRSGNSHRQCV